ncbi:hypothetical protein V6N11_042268 [Hibiscus sabdariffa]|uniref:Uncharacterized protein n=1 Tax=Hibiscus sabdariffa TaxID=183260 RepID=A0ABR2QVU4_9ROSI
MAHFNKIKILVVAIILVCNAPTFGARKVLSEDKMSGPVVVDRSIVASANRKVFSSTAKNGLAMAGNGMHSTWQSAWPEQSVPNTLQHNNNAIRTLWRNSYTYSVEHLTRAVSNKNLRQIYDP